VTIEDITDSGTYTLSEWARPLFTLVCALKTMPSAPVIVSSLAMSSLALGAATFALPVASRVMIWPAVAALVAPWAPSAPVSAA